jgi:hypothetical protein
MRSFLIAWVVAFALVAVLAGGVTWYVGSSPPRTPVARRQSITSESDPSTAPVFPATDAVEIVALRLPTDASGDRDRQMLKNSATVTVHSPQHWRVCFDGACWVAHGAGRYAEPENDAARQREGSARSAP